MLQTNLVSLYSSWNLRLKDIRDERSYRTNNINKNSILHKLLSFLVLVLCALYYIKVNRMFFEKFKYQSRTRIKAKVAVKQ